MKILSVGVCSLLFCGALHGADSAPEVPPVNELIEVLKNKLPDLSSEELNKAAARGLIKELAPRVQVITNDTAIAGENKVGGITRKEIYDGFAYLRVGAVTSNLDKELWEGWQSLSASNKVRGVVLDVRFAGGQDYEAAARTADHLVGAGELMKVGDKTLKAESSDQEIKLPAAILVNKQTQGAAEALAAVLREQRAGIIIGENTAGQARVYESVKLPGGTELLVGTVAVQVGEGKVPETGLAPDIRVDVGSDEQRAWYSDPYQNISRVFPGGTNVMSNVSTNRRRAFNEAELVRRHREGLINDTNVVQEGTGPAIIMDPVLGRALDFLKGITTLRGLRP